MFFPIGLIAQQELARYPVGFSQYYNCFSLVNPAASGSYYDYNLSLGNKRMLGNFNKISTYYFNANARLGGLKNYTKTSHSAVGVLFYNDREGKYLNRTRFYATYSWHAKLSKKVLMSGGFHIGAMNYSVKGTVMSGGGSDVAPDGMVGLQFYNEKFNAGISYNQIFNSSIQPIEEVAELARYANIHGKVNFYTDRLISLAPVCLLKIPSNGDPMRVDATFIADYKKWFRIIIGVHDNNKAINSIEFRNLLIDEHGLNISITYSYPLKRNGLATNFIEFGLSFNMNKLEY